MIYITYLLSPILNVAVDEAKKIIDTHKIIAEMDDKRIYAKLRAIKQRVIFETNMLDFGENSDSEVSDFINEINDLYDEDDFDRIFLLIKNYTCETHNVIDSDDSDFGSLC